MKKGIILVEHLIISLVSIGVCLAVDFLFLSFVSNFSVDQYYFGKLFSKSDIEFLATRIPLVVASVLFAYVVYLLLSLNTRNKLSILTETKSLNASLEQLDKLFDESPVPYIILNDQGEIYKSNKAALRFFKVVANEIENKNFFGFLSDENEKEIEKLNRYYKANIPINNEEVQFLTNGGGVRWTLLSVFKTKHPKDKKNVGLAAIFDITEQKKLDQAKTQFVSLASHQLRTPVATIKWFADMLVSGDLGEVSPKQKDYLERIHKVNEEMNVLIETLLNISRIEIGTIKPENKKTNVQELVESVILELSAQIENKKIFIEKDYTNDLVDIESDPKLLRIIIQNLVSNSVKYTGENGKIIVSLRESANEKMISVTDNGIGIPEEQQDKIFTKMFRANNAQSFAGSQGTGLGLYLIKSLVESMKGSISFVSKENEGSTFTIKF